MNQPEKVERTYYRCPYCRDLYVNSSFEDVLRHINKCTYNTELPERDCSSCKHSYIYHTRERCGHANGYRPECNVKRLLCKEKGTPFTESIHIGYNACWAYKRKQ